MKTYHLLLISLCGANAFQLSLRNVAIPLRKLRTPTSAPYNKTGLLISKFTKVKLLTKQSFAKTKQKQQDEIDNKHLLSIVTTCCLSLILRPRIANAYLPAQAKLPFNPLLDPTTLTYDIPGIDTLSNGIHGGAYNVGAIELIRRKALWIPLAIVSLGTWFYGGLVYYSTLLDGFEMGTYEDDYNISQEDDASVDWSEYSQVLLGPPSSLQSNEKPQTQTPRDDFKLESANRYYQEQQYKQHHHPVHVSRTKFEPIKYLDTLAINNEEVTQDTMPKTYLDTLSSSQSTWDKYKHQLSMSRPKVVSEDIDKLQIMKNLLTWDDYKHLVNELQSKKNEVNELKQEVNHLKSLLNIEQSIHQAATGGNYRQVEAEAHMQESETAASSSSTSELKELELLTEDYEKTLKAASRLKEEVEEYDIGSGIK